MELVKQQIWTADMLDGKTAIWMEEKERDEPPAWWIKHEDTDRAAPTKMRQLCLCTASTFDLVVKLVDITHSMHTWLQHERVVRLVIRWAPIYVAGGKCGTLTLSLQINTAFPFNCVVAKRRCLSSLSRVVQLLWLMRRDRNQEVPLAGCFICKWWKVSVSCCWAIQLMSCGMQIKCKRHQQQPCSHLFTVIRLISQNQCEMVYWC